MARRTPVFIAAMLLLAFVVALPAVAAQPSWANGKAKDKADKVPEAPLTISGVVESSTDADGETIYTLTDGGTTYTLHAGPRWFYAAAYPLEPYVGKHVTIDGEAAEGSTDVDVLAIDGTNLREPGKPPWAGGWKVVGNLHPGWSQEKADKRAEKAGRFDGCFPPGQCKDKSKDATEAEDESVD